MQTIDELKEDRAAILHTIQMMDEDNAICEKTGIDPIWTPSDYAETAYSLAHVEMWLNQQKKATPRPQTENRLIQLDRSIVR